MTEQSLICYEQISSKIQWKYTTTFKDDFEDIKVTDIEREICYCYGSTQYIMGFIELMKHKVIRVLPNLHKVEISLGIFDEHNILHRLMVGTYYLINKILGKEIHKKNIYKSIFVIIKYYNNVVFMGDICFDGIKD